MIAVSLFHTFLEMTLILFAVRLLIAKAPDFWLSRALTFTYG